MNRFLAFSLALTLALAGCQRSDSNATAEKNSPPAKDDTTAKNPVAFTPQTGRLLTSDEVPLLEQINRENIRVLSAVMPGIVRISASRQVDPRVKLFGKNLPFNFHFGPSTTQNTQESDPSYGAGVILRKDGYIVTNLHVVQDTKELEVQLHDRRTFPAQVIASDSALDLAVLKIEASDLRALPWGNSDRVQVGEQVFAIGNPFNEEGSVSRGIISATGRDLPGSPSDESYLQTDAAINPGNSGGALINIHGEVIGINTLIASTSGGSEGVGFSIPSNLASHVVEGLLKEASSAHGYLGVRFPETIDDGVSGVFHLGTKRGALLAGVDPGTPADKAGLHAGDFITEFDGHKIGSLMDLRLAVAQVPVGKQVALNYIRDGATRSTTVTIAEAPKSPSSNPSQPEVADASPPKDDTSTGANALTGLQVNDLTDKTRQQFGVDAVVTSGVVVGTVQYSSPADLKGVTRGDVIESVSVNHGSTRQLLSAKDFADVANELKPDQSVVLLIHHGKSSSFIFLAPPK